MSLNTKGFQLPVYLVKKVYTAGHVADLGPLEFGIFDKKTYSVATSTGNGTEFFLAGGSPHTKDKLSKFYKGMTKAKESAPFFGKDIESFEKVLPSRPENEQWVLGYGGGKNDNTLKFQKDKTYKLKLRLFGEPIYAKFAKSVEKIIPLYTGCSTIDDCDTSCTADNIGVKAQTKAWVKAINSNIDFQELKLKAQPVFSDYAATTASVYDYTLTISDAGDAEALQDVQRAYAGKVISRKSYVRGVSIYEMKAQGSAPASFTSKSYSVPVTNCTECASGTFTVAKDVYVVSRPLAGTEDLDDTTAQQTFADAVATQYKTLLTATIPTSDVNTTTDVITETAHGFLTGQKVNYLNGGGSSITGLVSGTDYYVIKLTADTFKVASSLTNALAGTAIDISGTGNNAQTFTPNVVATFLSQNGAVANVRLEKYAGSKTITAYLSDSVIKIATTQATCTSTGGATTAWVQGAGSYVVTRTLTATFANEDCAAPVDAATVQTFLSGQLKNTVVVTDITDSVGTGIDADHCVTVLQVVQTSFPLKDEYCLSPDNATFEDVPNWKGGIWKEADSTEAYDATIKAGIRFTVPSNYVFFGDDSYNLDERFDKEPIRMEVSIYEEEATPCTFSTLANARRVKAPKYDRLSGRYVRYEYIRKNMAYFPYEEWSSDNRNREVMNNTALSQIKADSYFVEYRLQYKEARDTHNFNQKKQHFQPRIFVEEGDLATQVALEAALTAITSKFGVELENVGKAK